MSPGEMNASAEGDNSTLRIKYSAKEVYLVMDGPKDAAVSMTLNGKAVTSNVNGGADVGPGGRVLLDGARLYKLIDTPTFTQDATLDISIPKGVSIMAFTFGG